MAAERGSVWQCWQNITCWEQNKTQHMTAAYGQKSWTFNLENKLQHAAATYWLSAVAKLNRILETWREFLNDLMRRTLKHICDIIPDHTWDFISYRTGLSGVRWMASSHFLMASQCLKETHITENMFIYDPYKAITHTSSMQIFR